MLDDKKYKIQQQTFATTSEQKEKMNRKVKRRSKKDEDMRSYLRKRKAKDAREKMINDEIGKIEECVRSFFQQIYSTT